MHRQPSTLPFSLNFTLTVVKESQPSFLNESFHRFWMKFFLLHHSVVRWTLFRTESFIAFGRDYITCQFRNSYITYFKHIISLKKENFKVKNLRKSILPNVENGGNAVNNSSKENIKVESRTYTFYNIYRFSSHIRAFSRMFREP